MNRRERVFAPVHLAHVGFVIVSHQVQNAMKDEDAHLLVEGASETTRVALGDGGRDSDIAEIGGNS